MSDRLVDYFVVVELQPVEENAQEQGRTRGRTVSDLSQISDASVTSSEISSQNGNSGGRASRAASQVSQSTPISSTVYAPVVVDRYPPMDYKDKPLEPFTANFALPVDDRPVLHSDDRQRSTYTFVLTNSARELTFGTTLRFCEATANPGLFMPKALCILSSHAWIAPLFEGFLRNLYNLTMFRVLTLPVEIYVQHFVEHASLPRPGSILRFESDATFTVEDEAGDVSRKVRSDSRSSQPSRLSPSTFSPLQLPNSSARSQAKPTMRGRTDFLGLDTLSFRRAPDGTLNALRGCVDAHFETLMSCLDASNVLLVLNAMVLDSKLMFHSRHVHKLTASLEALCALLFPFDWHHVYVPITPDHPDFLQMLDEEIIMPFMFGLHSDTFARVVQTSSGLSEVFIIDLDRNIVHVPPSAMDEGGGSTGMSEPFVPFPRHLVLRALEGMHRIVPKRFTARAVSSTWQSAHVKPKFQSTVHWHFRAAEKGEKVLDPWIVKEAAAVAAAAEKEKKAAAQKKATGAASSVYEHQKHNPLNWLFTKRSKKHSSSYLDQKDAPPEETSAGDAPRKSNTSHEPGPHKDEDSEQLHANVQHMSAHLSSASPISSPEARLSLVDSDLEKTLNDLFALWFTGRDAMTLSLKATGYNSASGASGAVGLESESGLEPCEDTEGEVQADVCHPAESWIDVLRCSVLEIFVSLLRDLPGCTFSVVRRKAKSENVASSQSQPFVFPEDEAKSSSNAKRGRLDMDLFLKGIDIHESQLFLNSLRSTQLWQQFQEIWENGMLSPDMSLFRGCIKRYVSGKNARTSSGKGAQHRDSRALVTKDYGNHWNQLSTAWWHQLCYLRKDHHKAEASNFGGHYLIKKSKVSNKGAGSQLPEFHVYAESAFPRLEAAMFEPTVLSGQECHRLRNSRRRSVKTHVVKVSMDEMLHGQAINPAHAEDISRNVTQTPLRKRRVSLKAMTALRFSMQDDKPNNAHVKAEKCKRTSSKSHLLSSKAKNTQNMPLGGGLFRPVGARDVGVKSAGPRWAARRRQQVDTRQFGQKADASTNILDDVKRLMAQTPGAEKGGRRVRRRLVDELFALRIGD